MYAYRQANAFQRLVRLSAGFKPMSWLYARTLHHIDAMVYRLSKGRGTFTTWLSGLPVVMLTTTGAKSGVQRTLPLLGIPDGEAIVVIASNYGQLKNPAWYHNLRANPKARLLVEGVTSDVLARELEGDDRERYYAKGIEIYPGWVQYRKRAPRVIPVIRLEPA